VQWLVLWVFFVFFVDTLRRLMDVLADFRELLAHLINALGHKKGLKGYFMDMPIM